MANGTGSDDEFSFASSHYLELVGQVSLAQFNDIRVGKPKAIRVDNGSVGIGDYREDAFLSVLPSVVVVAYLQSDSFQGAVILGFQYRRVSRD